MEFFEIFCEEWRLPCFYRKSDRWLSDYSLYTALKHFGDIEWQAGTYRSGTEIRRSSERVSGSSSGCMGTLRCFTWTGWKTECGRRGATRWIFRDGQVWGSPVYDWNVMEEDDCMVEGKNAWEHGIIWCDRLDHFSRSWGYTVSADAEDGRNGKWSRNRAGNWQMPWQRFWVICGQSKGGLPRKS